MSEFESDLEIAITLNAHINEATLYTISTDGGNIDAAYREIGELYTIANFDVLSDRRRRGVGKELLRASQAHARELGAKVIFAAIISRECLDAMNTVFGEESIRVSILGTYAPEGKDYGDIPTSAVLHAKLKE